MESIQGLSLALDYVSDSKANELLRFINAERWDDSMKRRVQHYGYVYDYKGYSVSKLDDLPDFLDGLVTGYIAKPDQCIVNEYQPGQGIAAHTDAKIFGPTICSLSLNSPCVMDFTKDATKISIVLPINSLLILTGEARYAWKHGIAPRKSDTIEGKKANRKTRVSLTFRTVHTDR